MMEPGTFFIFLIIFGIIGFFTEKAWGLNPYKIFADVGAFIVIVSLLFLFFPMILNPQNINGNIQRFTDFLVNFLPGAIVGDAAGTIIASITGGK